MDGIVWNDAGPLKFGLSGLAVSGDNRLRNHDRVRPIALLKKGKMWHDHALTRDESPMIRATVSWRVSSFAK